MHTIIHTPLGPMLAVEEAGFLTALDFLNEGEQAPAPCADSPLLKALGQQLAAYFKGQLRSFTIPLKPRGTAFQQAVWQQLSTIPYGQTASYGQLARAIGKPGASRVVGQANHNNPISILIPCHRCIGASGRLTGYGGGLHRKEALLKLEAEALNKGK